MFTLRPKPGNNRPQITRSMVKGAPQTLDDLRRIGPRQDIIQIVPPRHLYRPAHVHKSLAGNHELVTQPLSSPTGPGGAAGYRNRGGSQLAAPEVTNIYMGPFWADIGFIEGFSKAIVEYGYLQPLRDLGYGTGPGRYLGSVQGESLKPKTTLLDADARTKIAAMLDAGAIKANPNSLFMLLLPSGVTSQYSDGSKSCSSYCGYHDCFSYNGLDVAYAIIPAGAGCSGCGDGDIGDFTAVYAHELAEAATDKVPGQGWVADDGQECGDLEAWILFGWGPASDPKRYTIQGYYTNERGNTVGAWTGPA